MSLRDAFNAIVDNDFVDRFFKKRGGEIKQTLGLALIPAAVGMIGSGFIAPIIGGTALAVGSAFLIASGGLDIHRADHYKDFRAKHPRPEKPAPTFASVSKDAVTIPGAADVHPALARETIVDNKTIPIAVPSGKTQSSAELQPYTM